MNTWFVLAMCLVLSAAFSGSETGFYSLSRLRLELDVSFPARVVRRLMRSGTALLITVLIGNNLMLEIATHRAEHLLADQGYEGLQRELLLTSVLTPIVFLFGEVLPKEIFRRRPYSLLRITGPLIGLARIVFYPLERLLYFITWTLARLGGMREEDVERVFDRDSVLDLLREGARAGAIGQGSEEMAQNVLRLFGSPVERVHIPWSQVETVDLEAPSGELYDRVRRAVHTRLPVVDADGAVRGYLIGLDVLAAGPEARVEDLLLPLAYVEPGATVERAISRMRARGLRIACVGTPEEPLGLLGLKDLLERIAGELR